MRLWSIHPRYLDSKGLVALWREALLAQKVLIGKTVGYTKHPQLVRFSKSQNPIFAIRSYLCGVFEEANSRGYEFNSGLIGSVDSRPSLISVSSGQLVFEIDHLLAKLKIRDVTRYLELVEHKDFELHPLFRLVDGPQEPWEKSH